MFPPVVQVPTAAVYCGMGGRLHANRTEETRHKFRRIVATLKVTLEGGGEELHQAPHSFPLSVDPIIPPMFHTGISHIHH